MPILRRDRGSWTLANAALDGRKKGVINSRNATRMANIFGDITRCEVCGGWMEIKQNGRSGQFGYFGCSAAGVGWIRSRRGFCILQGCAGTSIIDGGFIAKRRSFDIAFPAEVRS
jgi:hypothetical protein